MTDPYLNVNATDEDESKRIIVHEILPENCSTNVSESKRNIVNKTLSQKNSTDLSEYNITELKDKEYKKPSVTKEVNSYFIIFEFGRNILDRLYITYQRAFMSTPQDKYYTRFLDNLVKINNRNGEPLSNENLRQAVSDVREETDAEHERNINKITCNTSFQYPIHKKDESTINNLLYYESGEHVDTIGDSIIQVDASNQPIKETHIVDRVCNLSVRVISVEPAVIGVRIIEQGITQGVINGDKRLMQVTIQ